MNNYLILAGAILFLIVMFFISKNILRLSKGEGITEKNKHEFVYLYFILGILGLIFGILGVSVGNKNFTSYSGIVVGLILLYYAYKNRS